MTTRSSHLDGTYWVVSLQSDPDAAYFISDQEGNALNASLESRIDAPFDLRPETYEFTDICGRVCRLAFTDFASLHRSTPRSRDIDREMSAELKARRMLQDDD